MSREKKFTWNEFRIARLEVELMQAQSDKMCLIRQLKKLERKLKKLEK